MKPQYPTYIRGAGVFIWFWAIALIYAVLFLHFRWPVEIKLTHYRTLDTG